MSPSVLLAVALVAAGAVQEGAAPAETEITTPRPEDEIADDPGGERRFGRTVARDFGRFYDVPTFRRVAIGLAAGGLLANTDADQEVQDVWREDVRSASTDDFAEAIEPLGDSWAAPTYVLLGLAAEALADGPPGNGPGGWLRRSGRAAAVGLPAVYYLQQMTGGERPSAGVGSDWEPFEGSHGVSGHAFLGALPFLTVARMSDRRWVDALAIAASTAAGFGRLNDDQHYLSQVALGWFLAWEATGAIAPRGAEPGELGTARNLLSRALPEHTTVTPFALPDGAGLLLTWRPGTE